MTNAHSEDRLPPEAKSTSSGALGPRSENVTPEGGPAQQLTPEEQMALFEKELKESDWGHQPC